MRRLNTGRSSGQVIGGAGVVAAAIAMFALAPAAASADQRVVLWPKHPDVELEGAAAIAEVEGVALVSLRRVTEAQGEAMARREAREAQALTRLDDALTRARNAYLEQRFADMAELLAEAEERTLSLTTRPERAELLWELQLQRGIAYLYRGEEGDAARALDRFTLCVELDGERRPARETYGPDVSRAFSRAKAERELERPWPLRIDVVPGDARVAIDGRPVIENRRGVMLRPGLHVVHASGAGYRPEARIVRVTRGDELAFELEPDEDGDPMAQAARAWAAGDLAPGTTTGRRALARVAREVGADEAWLIGEGDDPEVVALAASGEGLARRHTSIAGAADALRSAAGDAAAQADLPRSSRFYHRWWVWAGAGAVAAGAAITAAALLPREPSRLRVFPPEP